METLSFLALEVPPEHRVSNKAVNTMTAYILETQLVPKSRQTGELFWWRAQEEQLRFDKKRGITPSPTQGLRLVIKATQQAHNEMSQLHPDLDIRMQIPKRLKKVTDEVWEYVADYYQDREAE